MKEKNYDFLRRMREIHRPDRRNPELSKAAGELELDATWKLFLEPGFAAGAEKAMLDLQDYLYQSMGLSLCIAADAETEAPRLLFRKTDIAGPKGSYDLDIQERQITLSSPDLQGLWSGLVYLEDCMNLREAPFLPLGRQERRPLVTVRRGHSGCGQDDFPDWQLCAMTHAGFNMIDLFVKDFDQSTRGYCNINELIERAAEYGLEVFIYNYMPSYKHPDEADAEEFFDSIYGELFRRYPKAAGIKLCGESLQFPSKDPQTSGKRWRDSVVDGIPDTRPSPGWWPCTDYPDYIKGIHKAIRKQNDKALIVLNTYNWGYVDEELRRRLLSKLPKDIAVQITYEIFKKKRVEGLSCPVMDYTISATEPGEYFLSECALGHELGLELCSTTNSIGSTWDFGAAPYVPTPYRWIERFRHLDAAREKWGLAHYYETHHYGWWPNLVIDLRKAHAWSPRSESLEDLLEKLLRRDFGEAASPLLLECLRHWSEALDYYVASNEDQYGPWRVGSAYPLIFQPNITRTMGSKEIQFPTAVQASFGHRIIKTLYQPYENAQQSPGPLRYPKEIKQLEKMLALWEAGLQKLQKALPLMPANKLDNGARLEALGLYILHSCRTTINVKHWWLLNTKLQASSCKQEMLDILEELRKLAQTEKQNALDLIPAVEFDSRLGWEPSMEYVCDKWHLQWKARQIDSALREIDTYQTMLEL